MKLPFNEPSFGRARCPQRAGWVFDMSGGAQRTDARYRSRRGERGSATVLVLALVAIMMVFLSTNQRVLHNLKREVKLVEQKQLKKFQPPPAKPAAPPARP
ncbi:MAG: hypothetical protein ABMA26_18375 [Limisphaerales bacterium]